VAHFAATASNERMRRFSTGEVVGARHSAGLPDVISSSLNVVFCGINPGMRSATVGLHFANRSNRFWRVLHLAGFTNRQLEPEEARLLLDYGCGITSAVARATSQRNRPPSSRLHRCPSCLRAQNREVQAQISGVPRKAGVFSVFEPARSFVGITASYTWRSCGLGFT
jgi:mismatch-specific thymine-DNA glycosylase